ncbi:hypothetical protein JTE90_028409 [Oedothorax gibbosus]|uniref:G-protein coupled receptors family 1 profile domain-containing protein n=1 Tax=Oedothorax gibbosus TaxID=931172 RepID=A0AAV6VHV1_9ARAC|nr:hypothetical protein JTE90_028409 [Oedothorax gibbosus]
MDDDVTGDLLSAVLCVLCFLGLCSNGLIFLLLYRKHSLRTFSNRFVLSLAATHVLQCIFLIPSMVAITRGWTLSDIWCRVLTSSTLFLNLASVFNIVLIAVDRNCAVNSPLHYTLTITKKRTGLLISTAWLLAFLLALPPLLQLADVPGACPREEGLVGNFLDIVYAVVIAASGFVVPFSSVAVMYFAMFQAARDNSARTRRSSSNSSGSNEVIVNVKTPNKNKQGAAALEYALRRNYSSEHDDTKKDGCCCFANGKHKAAVTGFMVVVSFITCWLPFFASLMSDLYFPVPPKFRYFLNFPTYLSCVINPYLYFFRNKNAWTQAKKVLVGLVTRRRDNRFYKSGCGKKCPVELYPGLPLSQSVLAMNMSTLNTVSESVSKQSPTSRTDKLLSQDSAKSLLHQDSSSSNESCDVFTTTVGVESVLSMSGDSLILYQPFFSCQTMVDVPLHDTDGSKYNAVNNLQREEHS